MGTWSTPVVSRSSWLNEGLAYCCGPVTMSCKYSRALPNLWVNAVVISRDRLASVTRVMTDMALANVSLSTSLTLMIYSPL